MDTSPRPHPPFPHYTQRFLPRWTRTTKLTLLTLVGIIFTYTFLHTRNPLAHIDENLPNYLYNPHYREPSPQLGNYSSKAIIAASISKENTSWIPALFPEWDNYIYVNDNPNATYSIPGNKGRETSAYLTYIIDHYDRLPDFMVFIQGERYQWHNEDPMYDGVPILRNLRLQHVDKVGYANLRCTWDVGCPGEIHPEPDAEKLWDPAWPWVNMPKLYAIAFEELFPGEKMPKVVGVTCCSQFATTKKAVKSRSRKQYVRFRKWISDNEIEAGTTERVFEYMWHIILGRQPVHCPSVPQCFCDQFGLCNLPKCTKDHCKGRFRPVPFWTSLPPEWPDKGQGENGLPKEGWWEEELNSWWR